MTRVFFFTCVLLCCLPVLHSNKDRNNSTTDCPNSFSCPGLGSFKFPFYNTTDRQCGLIKVNCTPKGGKVQLGGRSYDITDMDEGHNIIIIGNNTFEDLVKKNSCEALMNNFTSPSPSPLLYSIISTLPLITLFKCTKNLTYARQTDTYFERHNYRSHISCKDYKFYYNNLNETVPSDLPRTCEVVQLPVKLSSSLLDESNIYSILSPVTSIQIRLTDSCHDCHDTKGGQCNIENGNFLCLSGKKENSRRGELILGGKLRRLILVLGLGVGFVTTAILIILCLKRKAKWRKNAKHNFKAEMFIRDHEFLAPKRFSYAQVAKMTNSFKFKLGQGGFGTVYKGVLGNQNLVAVNVLSELKGDGEDFINEVASVGRTSHVNIVSLIGFCLEGRKKALIYEFMPNGSLERFIYNSGSSNSSQLGWEKLHQIAIGIARGLEYLYRGCSTRILHFDIKPHNILLDNDFCPKISDFGLAKLFREKESKISMSHMRGTPGYIAPELFSRSFGEVSHKSDVYSYGMMILEMVGGRKNVEVGVDHSSEIYFPHWIYKKLELHEEQLELHGIVCDEEDTIARKMIIVGLWCIQTNPLSRPTITRVLEMLEGDLKSLEVPPKPYMSSPPSCVGSQSTESLLQNSSNNN